MRSSNSTLWLFPTCQVYSPSNACSVQSATLACWVEVSRASSNIGILLKLSQQFAITRSRGDKEQAAFGLAQYFEANVQTFSRPEQVGFICPFDDAHAGAIEIVLETEI